MFFARLKLPELHQAWVLWKWGDVEMLSRLWSMQAMKWLQHKGSPEVPPLVRTEMALKRVQLSIAVVAALAALQGHLTSHHVIIGRFLNLIWWDAVLMAHESDGATGNNPSAEQPKLAPASSALETSRKSIQHEASSTGTEEAIL